MISLREKDNRIFNDAESENREKFYFDPSRKISNGNESVSKNTRGNMNSNNINQGFLAAFTQLNL